MRRKVDLEPAVSGVERLRAERRWVGSSPQAPSGKTCVWVSFLSLDLEGREEFQVPRWMGARVGGADERGFCTKEGAWPGKLFISGLPVSGNGGVTE